MIYPKNPYCPLNFDATCPGDNTGNNGGNNNDSNNNNNNGNTNNNMTCGQMLKRIQELEFTLTDLNLYLDTHPDNKEALEMFTKLSASLKSLMYDYAQNCEALCVRDIPNRAPFEWAANNWPWQE